MATTPLTALRAPARERPKKTLERERHEPEYGILVSIVALAAIGILMVYSSSAIKSFLQRDDTFAIVGPQILWASLGIVAMLVMMRVDYRWLRVASIPMLLVGVAGLVLVFIPAINIEVGGSARWLKIGPLPAVHPAEFMKLALVVYLAHWFAKRGTAVRGFLRGTLPFLVIVVPVVVLVLLEPDLGTSSVLALTAFTMFFLAGANVVHLVGLGAAAIPVVALMFLRGYQMDRIEAWLNPWSDPVGIGFHSIQGYLALALGGLLGAGLGESRLAGGLFLPNAFNDYIFAIVGEEFGLLGGGLVIVLFLAFGYLGIRTSLGAPDTFGGLLAAGITAWICIQAFINIGVVVGLIPVTGIPLPFVSAGGSSLIISFAAVGILLSVSRETVEKGTWNDAPADRGRGHGRAHLPGPRRRPVAPRSSRRA
ncbi:MAG TPA: putative peptidoglycan glycosyltransferase FtsW [Candidatus Limnocylindrales bacterium]|nr:putative peptidoglycan glycosyltransferase FtsW [Candidatus Limnocylindrales bacterium]